MIPARPAERAGPRIRPVPLTSAAFAPYGAVLAHAAGAGRPVNAGTALRLDLAGFADRDAAAAPALASYRLRPQVLPLSVAVFERHPRSPQGFAALSVERFLVVVAPAGPDGGPDAAKARAFVGGRGAALVYARGQWHAPMVALGAGGEMLMLAFERGDAGDCVEHRLPAPLIVAE